MTELVPDIQFFTDEVPDVVPETTHELVCETCGKELVYAGRGRKPRFCEEHRKGSGSSRRPRSEAIGKNEQLAAQAAEALVSINTVAEMGLRFGHMEMTAETLALAKDGFRANVFEALKTDPELCKLILRGGVQSGRVQLVIAYAMLAAIIVPVATTEIKMRRAAKENDNANRSTVAGTTTEA